MMIWTAIAKILAKLMFGPDFAVIRDRINHFICGEHGSHIPMDAVLLLVVGEDRRFFSHKGVDVIGIARAIRNYYFYGRLEGASTIEQQLVRVTTGRYERTFARKLREIILASATSGIASKEHNAKAYIFYGYYGWRMNGMLQAQDRQGKRLTEMNEMELASLIARLKYPEPQKPTVRISEKIESRAKHIIVLKTQSFLQSDNVVRNGTV